MTIINAIRSMFGMQIQGAAHNGIAQVIFTDIYQDANGWMFSFRSENGKEGSVIGPMSKTEAIERRAFFVARRKDNSSFVHQGVAFDSQQKMSLTASANQVARTYSLLESR